MRRIRTLKWVGSKGRHLDFILPLLPPTPIYVEPFGGTASVLLNRPRSGREIYNDLDRLLAAFLRRCRDDPKSLIRAVRLTPHSRSEHGRANRRRDSVDADSLEAARLAYLLSAHSFSGKPTSFGRITISTGGGAQTLSPSDLMALSRRLQGVEIENRDALAVLRDRDSQDTLFYLDPPYVPAVRSGSNRRDYLHELDDGGQRDMAAALNGVQGLVAVSGYASELYEELYPASKGWLRHDNVPRKILLNHQKSGLLAPDRVMVESVWTNYDPLERL